MIEYSQGFLNLSDLVASDATEINILRNTRANFEIVKGVYGELFTSVGINVHELFKIIGYITKQRIDTDLTNNNFFPWDPNEQHIQNRILATYRDFYYGSGRFPGRSTLIFVPRARIPEFIRSQDVLSPRSLYESYVGRDMQGIVSVQFLAAFNRFLGEDTEISRDAMSELFHNLSWQALTNDNDSIMPQFDAMTNLVKNINHLLQKETYEAKKEQIKRGKKIVEQLTKKSREDNKTDHERVEEKVVDNIINNNQTDYTPYFQIPVLKTEDEIDYDRIEQKKQFLEGELAKNERDFEIIDDIEAKNRHDLIKPAIDPGDGIVTNEDITNLDYTKTERNEPAAPQLDASVLRGIGTFLQGVNQTINSEPDTPLPELEWIPEATYVEPATVRPDLQDILTIENETNDDSIEEIKNFKDEIKTEFDEIFINTELPSQNDMIEISDNESNPLEMSEIFSDGDFDDTEFADHCIPKTDMPMRLSLLT